MHSAWGFQQRKHGVSMLCQNSLVSNITYQKMASIKLAKHLNDRREARCFETVVDALLRFPLKN